MGMMKNFLIECIEELSRQTGYDFDFLMNVWLECMEDGNDWEFFKGVTLERDW